MMLHGKNIILIVPLLFLRFVLNLVLFVFLQHRSKLGIYGISELSSSGPKVEIIPIVYEESWSTICGGFPPRNVLLSDSQKSSSFLPFNTVEIIVSFLLLLYILIVLIFGHLSKTISRLWISMATEVF